MRMQIHLTTHHNGLIHHGDKENLPPHSSGYSKDNGVYISREITSAQMGGFVREQPREALGDGNMVFSADSSGLNKKRILRMGCVETTDFSRNKERKLIRLEDEELGPNGRLDLLANNGVLEGVLGEAENKETLGEIITVEKDTIVTMSASLNGVEALLGVTVEHSTNWSVDVKVCEDGKHDWRGTFVYASCIDEVRKTQFETLIDYVPNMDLGWCLMGNFNDLL
ncbi:hypothetical protein LIER_28422 [Lithospermum erythrorhizon]|uniref:Uncharacterized protein n=1 Tax=Lithospermum erythrorhizon TaxID=34254 RepID=A0AAV3RG06_LITER